MSYELKQCPYCGSWCHPKLVLVDKKYYAGASKVTTYKVVYPCICKTMTEYYLKPISGTNVDEVSE